MFDFKTQFQQLVDTYPLTDDMSRLDLAQKLEQSFFERLQTVLLSELSETDRNKLFSETSLWAEDFFGKLYTLHDDSDDIIEETFTTFKKEFLSKL